MKLVKVTLLLAGILFPFSATAADYPAPKQGEWIARDFKFHTGEVMPELKLAYTTVGDPKGQPVVVLHGTGGSAASMLTPAFAGELFGAGQPLDATKYFIVIPDGNSMGGMHTWLLAGKYPDYMDAAMPMASQPTAMASRNWMLRRMMLETIRNDPEYNNGNYTAQPRMLKIANAFFGIATNGGALNYQNVAPTFAKADEFVDKALAAPMTADANDFLYQWDSSRGFDASPQLDKITAALVAVNAADDERNPPETGIMDREIKRVKNGKVFLIPASNDTRGHGTTGNAKFYRQALEDLLKSAPQKAM